MSRVTELSDGLQGLAIKSSATMKLKAPSTPPSSSMRHPASHVLPSSPSDKAATVFPSHVRAAFRRNPADRTGELVRLLDDISTVTHSISSYVAEHNHEVTNLEAGQPPAKDLDPQVATQKLYTSLSHDGYACIILDKGREAPLTFSEAALHGGYVVMLSSLDMDPTTTDNVLCGTIFSVYKRKSSPSLPGRLKDLQQEVSNQVAAGYVLYSSATTLYYTMGNGASSFCLHPVATQYFLQPNHAINLPEPGTDLYADYAESRNDDKLGAAAIALCSERSGKVFDNGCMIANYHGATQSGCLFVCHDMHLLCEAAPLAYLVEQMGGKATDGAGNRILGTLRMAVSMSQIPFLYPSC